MPFGSVPCIHRLRVSLGIYKQFYAVSQALLICYLPSVFLVSCISHFLSGHKLLTSTTAMSGPNIGDNRAGGRGVVLGWAPVLAAVAAATTELPGAWDKKTEKKGGVGGYLEDIISSL